MPIAIRYYLAAGAVGGISVGGAAAAIVLFRRGQQEAATEVLASDAESVARLLRIQIDQAPLREHARAVGIDPDLVAQGYRDTRDGLVTGDVPTPTRQ